MNITDLLALRAPQSISGARESAPSDTPKKAALGQDDFLNMLLAQLENPASLPRQRVGLLALERVPVRDHTALQSEAGEAIGEVTSGLLSPTINQPVAMGYVNPAFAAIGTRIHALVRGKIVPMQVTPLPFVATRYHRG